MYSEYTTSGAPHSKLVETMVVIEEHPIRWRKPPVDLEKLAYLRDVEGWSFKRLADWAERSPITLRLLYKKYSEEQSKGKS